MRPGPNVIFQPIDHVANTGGSNEVSDGARPAIVENVAVRIVEARKERLTMSESAYGTFVFPSQHASFPAFGMATESRCLVAAWATPLMVAGSAGCSLSLMMATELWQHVLLASDVDYHTVVHCDALREALLVSETLLVSSVDRSCRMSCGREIKFTAMVG